ncbi:MAG: leucine-rich repeat protein [Candidatus Coproplasma sp.]
MIDIDQAIFQRHSVRNFSNKAVDIKTIADILNAGRLAPSAKNRQPWRFEIADNSEKEKIALFMEDGAKTENDKFSTVTKSAQIVRHAPVVIVVFLTSTSISDYISLGACLENMSLKATDLGLGSLIVCDTQCCSNRISNLFLRSEEAVALLLLGYEAYNSKRAKKLPLKCLVDDIPFDNYSFDILDDLPEANVDDKPFVFISYSHKDAQIVISDIIEMKKHGVRLWYDCSILFGEKWDECVLNIIRRENCVGVIIYVSDNSVNSENVAKEIECAKLKFGSNSTSIIGVHIGGKVLSEYNIMNNKCLSVFSSAFSDTNKYISRACNVSRKEGILSVIEQAERLGAVAECGVYDEFKYRRISEGIEILQYNGSSVTVSIPSSIAGLPVVSLGKNMFKSNDIVRKVIVPYTVKIIGDGAFSGMTALAEVELTDNVERIGVAAFRGCSSLKSIILPENVVILEEALFRDCTSLESVRVPKNVKEFGEAVFRGCSSLKSVYMPSVLLMTEGGFYGCSNLNVIVASPELKGLEEHSFETCPNINVDLCGFSYRNGKCVKSS